VQTRGRELADLRRSGAGVVNRRSKTLLIMDEVARRSRDLPASAATGSC
jgi:hypothetical protein